MSLVDKIREEYLKEGFDLDIREISTKDGMKYELVIQSAANVYDYGNMEEVFMAPVEKIKTLRRSVGELETEVAQLEHKNKELEQYKTFYELYKGLK